MLHFQSAADCVHRLFGAEQVMYDAKRAVRVNQNSEAAVRQINNELTDTIKALWSREEPQLQVINLSEFITSSDLFHILILYITIIKISIIVTVMESLTPLLR